MREKRFSREDGERAQPSERTGDCGDAGEGPRTQCEVRAPGTYKERKYGSASLRASANSLNKRSLFGEIRKYERGNPQKSEKGNIER